MVIPNLTAWIIAMLSRWRRTIAEAEAGQGLVEYALILVLVVLVAFIVVVWIGPWVGNIFSNVVNNL